MMRCLLLFLFFCSPLNASELSYTLIKVNNGKVLEKKAQNLSYPLASVSKLYTFYYALNQLKGEETFKTQILKEDKTYTLLASGDPYLTLQNLLKIIYQLKNMVKNNQIQTLYYFTENNWSTSRLSSIGLEDQPDNPSMGSLNVEFNRFKVHRPSNKTIPPMKFLNIVSKDEKSDGLKFKYNSSSEGSENWIKFSKENHKYLEELPTRRADLYGANYFKYLANLHGLKITNIKYITQKKGHPIITHVSLPVERLIQLGIEYSNNLIAEMILQKIHNTSPEKATRKMLKWYQSEFKADDISWEGIKLKNASGLGLDNQSTSINLAKVLAAIHKKNKIPHPFISYLSINAHSGGVRNRLNHPKYAHRVYAKTGSLFYVNNLAGYLRANSGDLYAFAIFMTDKDNREVLNQKNSKLVNNIRSQNKKWQRDSTIKIESLLRSWIKKY